MATQRANQCDELALSRALEPLYRADDIRSNLVAHFGSATPAVRAAIAEALAASGNGEGSPNRDDQPERPFRLLRELEEDPELLRPPPAVVPPFAYRGRTSGLVGPDKSGKSTLAAHAVAQLTRGGSIAGERLKGGNAVVAAPDEAVGDTVRRLYELGTDPDRVHLLALRPPDLLGALDALLEAQPADLVVVDSLAEWARLTLGRAPDDGDAAGWGAVVRPLVQVSRARDTAVLVLHHPRRSDGQYRGSGEIAAAFDCLIEMTLPQSGEDPTLRRFRGRGRWPIEDFTLRMEEGWYVLGGGGAVSIEARILMDVRANPGTTRADSYRRLGGRKATHTAAVSRIVDSEGLVDRGGKLYVPGDVEEDLLP
jgi:hypothetical protein